MNRKTQMALALILVATAILVFGLPLPFNPVAQIPTLYVESMPMRGCLSLIQYPGLYSSVPIIVASCQWWLHITAVEIAEGCAVIALFLFLSQFIHLPEGRPRVKSRLLRVGLLTVGGVFLFLFVSVAFFAHLGIVAGSDGIFQNKYLAWVVWQFVVMYHAPPLSSDNTSITGIEAFVFLCLAWPFFSLCYGYKRSFLKFIMPTVLGYTLFLLLVYSHQMQMHVMMSLASFNNAGVPLISNWFVLVLSAFLSAFGFLAYRGKEQWQ
jgi:hypothetical protein